MKFNIACGLTCLSLCWGIPTYANSAAECNSSTAQASARLLADEPLPQRTGSPVRTSGRVPHVQLNVDFNPEINKELRRLSLLLPGLEERPTIVSLAGAKGLWLGDKVSVVHRSAIVSGREFAHIHTDGSLHAPLPYERALELEEKGWGERHPWADSRDGWEGLVMLYSATTAEQLGTLVQLVTESYSHVTGQAASVADC